MKDVQRIINRKKLMKKMKPGISAGRTLDIIKIVLLALIVLKLYGLH